jgi:hypothetical protein
VSPKIFPVFFPLIIKGFESLPNIATIPPKDQGAFTPPSLVTYLVDTVER